jgi:hypothetical protein
MRYGLADHAGGTPAIGRESYSTAEDESTVALHWIHRLPPLILKHHLRFRYRGSCTGFVDSSIETVDKPQPELRLRFQYSVFLTTWPTQPCFAACLKRDPCNMMFANTSYFVHDIGAAALIRLRIRCRKSTDCAKVYKSSAARHLASEAEAPAHICEPQRESCREWRCRACRLVRLSDDR